jgi:hypothetical protein
MVAIRRASLRPDKAPVATRASAVRRRLARALSATRVPAGAIASLQDISQPTTTRRPRWLAPTSTASCSPAT